MKMKTDYIKNSVELLMQVKYPVARNPRKLHNKRKKSPEN